jgi:hypothetical protein
MCIVRSGPTTVVQQLEVRRYELVACLPRRQCRDELLFRGSPPTFEEQNSLIGGQQGAIVVRITRLDSLAFIARRTVQDRSPVR